jgi:hypothetical protein
MMLGSASDGMTAETFLTAFIKACAEQDLERTLCAYRKLLEAGNAAVPVIVDAIKELTRNTAPHNSTEARCVTGLFSILNDLDELLARALVQEFEIRGLSSSILYVLQSICRFTKADYSQYTVLGIRVFEHKGVRKRQLIRPHLERWLRAVPETDLVGIGWITIVGKERMEPLGNYIPGLCSINLVWDNPYSKLNPASYVNLYTMQNVLYHEIGHHVYGHSLGRNQRGETDANKYADYVMSLSSRLHFRLIRAVFGSPRRPSTG